jgi:hypothetical protein
MGLPVLIGIGSALGSIGAWLSEFALQYGKKILLFTTVVAAFFATLYIVTTAVFAILDATGITSTAAAASTSWTILRSVFPTNFIPIMNLIIAVEFQIFFWRWANKVLNLKVDIFH